ncbi:hypothetical protein FOA52_012840 [Chlamydomonas sp. UWO 241]|nr:hypothetical protein FOA52_012840 [Chlamydomonas sp. UWO 241]
MSATNFAVMSSSASGVSLCLFTEADLQAGRVTAEVELNPVANRTGDVWHCALPGLSPDLLYGYRVSGPHQSGYADSPGQRYDATQVVLDPYTTAVVSRRQYGQLSSGPRPTWPQAAGAVPSPPGSRPEFDWQGDRPLRLPMQSLVLYEMHVRGFTQADASLPAGTPGTYAGMVERLDYLQKLGVNAVELLPVQEFNELEYHAPIPGTNSHRVNFWGYSTVGFFAPMSRYSAAAAAGGGEGDVRDEFKALVRECHKRGIEVILDVVFNHTAEGNERGPTLSFRGLDNRLYYMLAPEGEYYNYSGCGNVLNCNHPVVRTFIVDCLRYWVTEYHVDGFRFDLASVLTRAHSVWHPLPRDANTGMLEMPPRRVPGGVRASVNKEGGGPASATAPQAAPMGLPAAAVATAAAAAAAAVAAAGLTGGVTGAGGPSLASMTATAAAGSVAAAFGTEGAEEEARAWGHMGGADGVPTGTPLTDPPLIQLISEDPVLRDAKLIAEAWDSDGLNQVGSFPHYNGRWSEWNGRFRDTVRQFIKGTNGPWASNFAAALCGSADVYASPAPEDDWWGNNGGHAWRGNRGPTASINFITAHDGFTLADLVSYNEKSNLANGEGNRDGESHNLSWNCGEEGPSDDAGVKTLRQRQMRNMLVALLLSHGVPMLLMGDEYGHSKGGNNNTYCHDSELNYLDWAMAGADADGLLRFTRAMIAIRKRHATECMRSYYPDTRPGLGGLEWHGIDAGKPDWSDTSRFVAFSQNDHRGGGLYIAFNTSHVAVFADLPRRAGMAWAPLVDTSRPPPYDALVPDDALSAAEVRRLRAGDGAQWTAAHTYPMLPWSCVVLEAVPVVQVQVLSAPTDAKPDARQQPRTSRGSVARALF